MIYYFLTQKVGQTKLDGYSSGLSALNHLTLEKWQAGTHLKLILHKNYHMQLLLYYYKEATVNFRLASVSNLIINKKSVK